MDMFEKATRGKYRFPTSVGMVTMEDLYDLPLTSNKHNHPNLNDIAKSLNRRLKTEGEEDFVNPEVEVNRELKVCFEIVKHVIEVKLRERDAAEKAQETRAKKSRILEILAKKQDQELEGKSEDELRSLLESM